MLAASTLYRGGQAYKDRVWVFSLTPDCESKGSACGFPIVFDVDSAAEGLHDLLAYVQANADAGGVNRGSSFQFAEQLEELGLVFCLDAYPLVTHLELQHVPFLNIGDIDLDSASFSELQGVLEQIKQYLIDALAVSDEELRDVEGGVELQAEPLLEDGELDDVEGALDALPDVAFPLVLPELLVFYLLKVQQVLNQKEEYLAGVVYNGQKPKAAGVVDKGLDAVEEASHGVEGRAHVVGDGGSEHLVEVVLQLQLLVLH